MTNMTPQSKPTSSHVSDSEVTLQAEIVQLRQEMTELRQRLAVVERDAFAHPVKDKYSMEEPQKRVRHTLFAIGTSIYLSTILLLVSFVLLWSSFQISLLSYYFSIIIGILLPLPLYYGIRRLNTKTVIITHSVSAVLFYSGAVAFVMWLGS